jgi:hypothetical protein
MVRPSPLGHPRQAGCAADSISWQPPAGRRDPPQQRASGGPTDGCIRVPIVAIHHRADEVLAVQQAAEMTPAMDDDDGKHRAASACTFSSQWPPKSL